MFEAFSNLYMKLGALVKNLGVKGINGSHEMFADTAILNSKHPKKAKPTPLWALSYCRKQGR